jgi:hypothetical protein
MLSGQLSHTVHGCLPAGDLVAGHVSLRVQQLDVSCETKTKDNVFVVIVVSALACVSLALLECAAPAKHLNDCLQARSTST